jgi:MFS family permease
MAAHARAQGSRQDKAFSWRFVTPMLLGSSLNPVNSSLIATALVPIAHAMHVPAGQTAVLVSGLYLASSIAQPTAGKLSEEFGPRRIFLAGILLVLAGGLVGGFAPDLTTLLVARVLIGVGTSAGYPSAMLMIRRRAAEAGLTAPPGSVLGGLVIAGMVTPAVGLPLGGILVNALSWRASFFVNVPLALVTLAMATIWIPRDQRSSQVRTVREIAARIDLCGIVGFGGTMAALLVFLMSLPRANWTALGVTIILGVALAWWELRARHPFFDVRLLARNLALTRTYMRWAILGLCVYTVLYGVTQWLQAGRGMSALEAGLIQLPMSAISSVIARPVSQRNLLRLPLIAAAVACLAGSAGVLLVTGSTPIGWIIVVTLMFGITLGTGASANQTALYAQVPAAQIGTASGLFRTFGYIGSIASSAIIAITFHSGVSDQGLHSIALIMVVVSAVALALTLADRHLMRQSKAGQSQESSEPASSTEGSSSRSTDGRVALPMPFRRALVSASRRPASQNRV